MKTFQTYWKLFKTYWKFIKTYWKLIKTYYKFIRYKLAIGCSFTTSFLLALIANRSRTFPVMKQLLIKDFFKPVKVKKRRPLKVKKLSPKKEWTQKLITDYWDESTMILFWKEEKY